MCRFRDCTNKAEYAIANTDTNKQWVPYEASSRQTSYWCAEHARFICYLTNGVENGTMRGVPVQETTTAIPLATLQARAAAYRTVTGMGTDPLPLEVIQWLVKEGHALILP